MRRPLFWLLVVYVLLLFCLRRHGFFDVPLPENVSRSANPVEVLAVQESVVREGRVGAGVFVESLRVGGVPCRRRIFARLSRGRGDMDPGTILRLKGRLSLPRRPRHPGDFDQSGYLRDRGVTWVMHAAEVEAAGSRRRWRDAVSAWAGLVRRSIRKLIDGTYPEPSRSLLRGVLLGDKGNLDASLARAMKDAGVFHLIVPSGTNVTFICAFFFYLAGLMRLGPIGGAFLSLAMAAFYGLVLGADPPYLRAFLCAALAAGAKAWDRSWDLFQALVVSAFALLLWEPRTLFHQGFQMSYLAVAALMVVEPGRVAPSRWPRPVRLGTAMMIAGAAAQLALVPSLAMIFGKFSLIGILANIALVPLCGLILGAGYALWVLSLLPIPLLFKVAAGLTGLLAESFCRICAACASWPGAAIGLRPMTGLGALGYFLLVFGIFLWRHPRTASAMIASGLCLLFAAVCRTDSPNVRVTVLGPPGPGAALVTFPGERHWLVYGCGPPGVVLKALKFYGIESVEKIILLDGRFLKRSRKKILREVPAMKVLSWGRRPFEIRHGRIRFLFSAEGLKVFKDGVEMGRKPQGAIEIAVEGPEVSVKNF